MAFIREANVLLAMLDEELAASTGASGASDGEPRFIVEGTGEAAPVESLPPRAARTVGLGRQAAS